MASDFKYKAPFARKRCLLVMTVYGHRWRRTEGVVKIGGTLAMAENCAGRHINQVTGGWTPGVRSLAVGPISVAGGRSYRWIG